MRQTLQLPFSILCDPERSVITAWGLLNPREHGGIAIPSMFVIGNGRRIELASVDRTVSRVMPEDILRFLVEKPKTPQAPARQPILPSWRNFAGSLLNGLRHGFRSPRSNGFLF